MAKYPSGWTIEIGQAWMGTFNMKHTSLCTWLIGIYTPTGPMSWDWGLGNGTWTGSNLMFYPFAWDCHVFVAGKRKEKMRGC